MTVRTLRYVAAITLCLILAAGAVNAVSFTYSSQAKRIKAGVIILPNTARTGAGRPNPYIFYVMDQRTDLKPSGWEFYNPFAPSQVTSDIMTDRWMNTYRLGETVDKSMGCYWEVPISLTSPEDLAQYDVLFLTGYNDAVHPSVNFSSRDKEKLRKFVDNGGVLWVDYERTSYPSRLQTVMDPNTFFMGPVIFTDGGVGMGALAIVPPRTRAHSLLNRPFFLSPTDIQLLGGYGPSDQANTEYIELSGFAASVSVPIVTRGLNTTICAAQYGSGYVVITADNVGQAVTNPVGAEVTGRCGRMINAAQPEDLRFAYNIVNWGSEHSTYQKNARRTGSSFAEIGMSLVDLWRYNATTASGKATDSSPAILDDMIFYVDGDNVLHAFDLSPTRDRDGNGDPDDGMLDYSKGAPYDQLWEVEPGGKSSPPTAAYAPIVDGEPAVPAVFVVTASGVKGFNALGYVGANPPPAVDYFTAGVNQQFKPFAANDRIPAPTYVDGALYAGDGFGLLHVHDFLSGNAEWCHPLSNTNSNMGVPSSPSVGYFYDPTSGATEQVAYIATHGTPGGSPAGDGTVRAYPIRVFNEALTRDPSPNELRFKTRNANTSIDPTPGTYVLYYQDPQSPDNLIELLGSPLSVTQIDAVSSIANGPTCLFRLTTSDNGVAIKAMLDAGGSIFAEYKLRYITDATAYTAGNPGPIPAFRSIGIRHRSSGTPPGAVDNAGISGSPAAGKNDILYFGTENGQFYAVKESGRGANQFTPLTVKWRWYLGDPKAAAVLGGTFTGWSKSPPVSNIVGAPALVGDMVYFAVNDDLDQGYLLAFKADPQFSITLDKEITPNTPVTVVQADKMTGMTGANSPTYLAVPFTDADKATPNTTALVDFDTRKITFVNFKARNGELTASEDLVVRYQPFDPGLPLGTTPPVIEESHPAFATGARDQVNNLVWFMKFDARITSSPTAMGDVVYLGSDSGRLYTVDVGKANQKKSVSATGVSQILPSDFDYVDYVRVTQIPKVTDPIIAPVAGSHGMLAVATAAGLSIMYNPVTLVADGNRLVEVNADGTLWTCDSTNSFAGANAEAQSGSGADKPVFGASNIPFNRPSVARKAYVGGTIVADTGNNRIVHIDKGGTAIWEIKDFVQFSALEFAELQRNANPIVRPGSPYPLLPPGSPMELNKPTDVTCWMTMDPMDIFDNTSQRLPVYHYLIADGGNHRVVEIVNRYEMATRMRRNYLLQVSKEEVQPDPPASMDPTPLPMTTEGRALQFRTARISTYGANPSSSYVANGPSEIVCAVADEDSSKLDMTGSGGALIRIDWTTGNIKQGTVNSLPINDPANPLITLVNPSFYNRQMVSNTEYADVVIDARGVHVLNKVGNNPPTFRSYLNVQHVDMYEEGLQAGQPILNVPGFVGRPHPRPFAPSYAQYLPNGNVLVTNKATGKVYEAAPPTALPGTAPTERAMYGEIFELDPGLIRIPGTSIWEGFHQPLSAERALY